MNIKLPKNLIVFCCMILVLACSTNNTAAQEGKSVLNRVQKIEDPELGELIRIAIENFNTPELADMKQIGPYADRYEKLKATVENQKITTVRKITEAYSQIKLLDSQIEQIEKRLSISDSPEALANELFLAKTELEVKLANKLAELREAMHIIPIHPLGTRSIEKLNKWIRLDVIGEYIAVFDCSKPFNNVIYDMKHNFVKLMLPKEVLDYISENTQTLPIRIDILRNTDGIKLSEELQNQIIDFIKENNLEMEAEVHLDDEIATKPATCRLYIQNKSIGTRIVIAKRTATGTIERLDNTIDPNEVDNYIQESLIGEPSQLPQTISLQHDEESEDLAKGIENKAKDFIKEKGIEKLVTIKMELYHLKNGQ